MGTADSVNQTIDSLLNDWSKIVYLYNLVHDFADQFKNGMSTDQSLDLLYIRVAFIFYYFFFSTKTEMNLQNFVVIKSYSYTNLLIGYGPNKEVTVSIFWCTKSREYKMIFNGGNSAINAHTIMREQLQAHLNRHHNLSQIVHIIHETYQPLSSIAKLPIIPQLGIPVCFPSIHIHFGPQFSTISIAFFLQLSIAASIESGAVLLHFTAIANIASCFISVNHVLYGNSIAWWWFGIDS